MASSPWYKTQRVAAMAPLQLYLAVFRDFRRGGKKIHAQPMGDGKHRNGNWQRISSSWNEELCWRNPRPEYSSVGVCYVSSCGLFLTRESWTISLKSESTPKATATSKQNRKITWIWSLAPNKSAVVSPAWTVFWDDRTAFQGVASTASSSAQSLQAGVHSPWESRTIFSCFLQDEFEPVKAIQGHAHRRWHMIHVDSPRRSFHCIICICSSYHGFCKTRWWDAQGKWNFMVKLNHGKNPKAQLGDHISPAQNLLLDHFHVIIGFDVDFGWKGDRPLSCCKLAWEITVKKSERQYTVKVRFLQWKFVNRNPCQKKSTTVHNDLTGAWTPQSPKNFRRNHFTGVLRSCSIQNYAASTFRAGGPNTKELYRIILLAVSQRAPKAKQGSNSAIETQLDHGNGWASEPKHAWLPKLSGLALSVKWSLRSLGQVPFFKWALDFRDSFPNIRILMNTPTQSLVSYRIFSLCGPYSGFKMCCFLRGDC